MMKSGFIWAIVALILVFVFAWDKIKSAWDEAFRDESAVKGKDLKDKQGNTFTFNYWTPGAYKNLSENGYNVKVFKHDFAQKIAQDVRDSGILVYRDNEIMGALRKCLFQTQFNQVVTLFVDTAIPIVKPETDLNTFLKDKLDKSNYNQILEFVKNLPTGYEKAS